MFSTTRRKLLHSTVIGSSISIAGCSQGIASSPQKSDSVQEGGAKPARSCPDDVSAFNPWWTVDGTGPIGGFRLSVEQSAYALGDTVTCSLQNIAQEPRSTGNPDQYDIQYRGEDGWRTIYTTPHDDVEWATIGVSHDPGTGFTWEFPLTQTGLSNVDPNNTKYVLCGPIQPGDYRFVYWALTQNTTTDEQSEVVALSVSFTVTDD